ncbi:MAG: hypothetical protein L0221_01960, partial [Chloroflexi bacterium]|nr:hypothetical protein [Chloroflexota bacterium]
MLTFLEAGVDDAHYFFLQDNPRAGCEADEAGCQPLTEFTGYGVIDRAGRVRPVARAFELMARMGRSRVAAEPWFEVVQGRQEWGGLATRTNGGALQLLIRNWDPERDGETIRVQLATPGFTPSRWTTEEVGVQLGDERRLAAGSGAPPILVLPSNHTVLTTLVPQGVDAVPPQTRIDSGEASSTHTVVRFSGNDDKLPVAGFDCRLDAAGWTSCRSPLRLSTPAGGHTLRVRAVDEAGNVDPSPAIHQWTALAEGDSGWIGPVADAADLGGAGGDGFSASRAAYDDGGEAAENIDGVGDRHVFVIRLPAGSGRKTKGLGVRTDWWADTQLNSPVVAVEISIDGGETWSIPRRTDYGTLVETESLLGGPNDLWGFPATAVSAASEVRIRVAAQCQYDDTCAGKDW